MNENVKPPLNDPLTIRELEILNLVASGLTNRDIAGKLFLALETIRWYTKRIYRKMGVSNRTQAVTRAMELGVLGQYPQVFPSSEKPILPRHNLPAQVTPFLGRRNELKDLSILLSQNETRLITILAPGGMGKSRLAVQLAKANLPIFSDGVFFIPLEHLTSDGHMISTIAENLNIQNTGSDRIDQQLISFLQDKEILLVMDSFEHLLPGNMIISDLLGVAPKLKILVTSRDRLDVQGETVYKLEGLSIPSEEESPESIASSAVQLFIQSAQQVQPKYVYKPEDLTQLVCICRLVGGMPLGIILAAAWTEVLSLREIANEISSNLDFLSTERKDIPERHRSVRAVFDYSMQILQGTERSILYKLSIFRGGFTREGAQAVSGSNLELLAQFVRKSLLQHDPLRKRYRMHELLRQYAFEKLDEEGLYEPVQNAHMNYYADFLCRSEIGIKGGNQIEALDQVQLDFENIRKAWLWAVKQNDIEVINASLECVYWFCSLRGRVSDGEDLFKIARDKFANRSDVIDQISKYRLLVRFDASGDEYKIQLENALEKSMKFTNKADRALLLWAYGVNGYAMQDLKRSITNLEESLRLFMELEDQFYIVETLHLLWVCNRLSGQIDTANDYHDQVLSLCRKSGNKIALARALGSRGAFDLFGGNYSDAEIHIQEALDIRLEISDHAGVAMSMAFLGWLASIRGELEGAKMYAESSLKIASDTHNLNCKATAINSLGWIACLEGQYAEAKRLCEESLTLAPDPTVVVEAELVLSITACGQEDYQRSETLLIKVLDFYASTSGSGLLVLCLPAAAIILAQKGRPENAVQYLAFASHAQNSYTGWMEYWEPISRLRSQLESDLGEKCFQTNWEIGTSHDFKEVITRKIKTDFQM